jgi:hypothetical protein
MPECHLGGALLLSEVRVTPFREVNHHLEMSKSGSTKRMANLRGAPCVSRFKRFVNHYQPCAPLELTPALGTLSTKGLPSEQGATAVRATLQRGCKEQQRVHWVGESRGEGRGVSD